MKFEKNILMRSLITNFSDQQNFFQEEIERIIKKLIEFLEMTKKENLEIIYSEIFNLKQKFYVIEESLNIYDDIINRNVKNLSEKYQIMKNFSTNIYLKKRKNE